MNTIFGAFMIALMLGALVAFLIVLATGRQNKPNYQAATRAGLIVLLVVFAAGALMDAFTQVEAGSVAVVKQFGQVVGVFYPGLNIKAPFIQQTVPYRTQEIIYETSEDVKTSQADLQGRSRWIQPPLMASRSWRDTRSASASIPRG